MGERGTVHVGTCPECRAFPVIGGRHHGLDAHLRDRCAALEEAGSKIANLLWTAAVGLVPAEVLEALEAWQAAHPLHNRRVARDRVKFFDYVLSGNLFKSFKASADAARARSVIFDLQPTEAPMDDIDTRFNHHPPRTNTDADHHELVRSELRAAAHRLDRLLPDGREKALVLTKLEEAMFWSNAALARKRGREAGIGSPEAGAKVEAMEQAGDEKVRAVDDIARVAHEANRAYCYTLGDNSQKPWGAAPEWQRRSAREGVRAILAGEVTGPRETHESWLREKRLAGWTYGAEKDHMGLTHPCMVEWEELPLEQRRKDELFFAIVSAFTL